MEANKILKMSDNGAYQEWAKTAEVSQAQKDTHMKVCVFLEEGSTKYVVDTYAAWVYVTTQMKITYNVIDRVVANNSSKKYQPADSWKDTETRRNFLSKLEDIVIARKSECYNKYSVEEERRAQIRKAHGSLIVNLKTVALGAAELG